MSIQRDDCINTQSTIDRSVIELGSEGIRVTEGHVWVRQARVTGEENMLLVPVCEC